MVTPQGGKSHRVTVWELQALRLKICGTHLTSKVANKMSEECLRAGESEK